jgi:cytochrome c
MRKLMLASALLLLTAACHRGDDEATARELTGGDPKRGAEQVTHYGCGACHEVPGVGGANGQVGPPLRGIAARTYLAGQLPNNPGNMVLWIQQPQKVEPNTNMPNLGVTDRDAHDIAAYLYTLR